MGRNPSQSPHIGPGRIDSPEEVPLDGILSTDAEDAEGDDAPRPRLSAVQEAAALIFLGRATSEPSG